MFLFRFFLFPMNRLLRSIHLAREEEGRRRGKEAARRGFGGMYEQIVDLKHLIL